MKNAKSIISHTACKQCAEKLELLNNDSTRCSCANCDSFDCFELRNKGQCSCKTTCNVFPTCLRSDKIITKIINKDFISGCKNSVKTMSDSDCLLKELLKKEITYEYGNNNNISTYKKHSGYSYSGVDSRDKDDVDDDSGIVTHAHSDIIVCPRKGIDTDTAKLSAQIMNVPYKDFKESLSYNRPTSPTSKLTKLTKFDIFKRIKEAYKACSCKVCECIVGKSIPTRNDYCKCKPCDCKDCATLLKEFNRKLNIKQHFVGCPCIRCNRAQCKGVVKKSEAPLEFCDCDPCDCLKCSDSFSKPCNCQPCECIECKSYAVTNPRTANTIVVSTMREDNPRSYCQCSPCDCAECGQDYPMSSSLRHEMATGINRPANCTCDNCASQSCEASDGNSCTCEVQKKIMRKPVEKDTRDYDIHRASVKKVAIDEKCTKKDTIAMFAAVGNSFPRLGTCNKNVCSCGDCECILCSCKDNNNTSIKNTTHFQHLQGFSDVSNNVACKCLPCECEVCTNIVNKTNRSDQCHSEQNCKCSVCDCLNCLDLSKPSTSNPSYLTTKSRNILANNAVCKCSPCECTDCQKNMYKCTGVSCSCTKCKCQICPDQSRFIHETVYRNISGYVPLPCSFGMKCNDDYNIDTNKSKVFKFPTIVRSTNVQPIKNKFPNFDGLDENPVKDVNETSTSKSSQFIALKKKPTLTCEAYVQCKDNNVIMQYCNQQTSDYKSSMSCFMSEKTSLGKTKLHFNENSSSMPPISIQKSTSYGVFDQNKSNAMFTDISISKCLKDFLKFNFDSEKGSLNEKDKVLECRHSDGTDTHALNSSDISSKQNSNVPNEDVPNTLVPSSVQSNNTLNVDKNGIRDLSLNLVTSLRKANKRLSTLMHPKDSLYSYNIGPSKANISLPSTLTSMTDKEQFYLNFALSSNVNNTDDLSVLDINYEKVNKTLQQAKAFSEDLIKVLDDYKMANERLQIHSHNQMRHNKNFEPKCANKDKMVVNDTIREKFNENIKPKSQPFEFEPMKKYGSHNLHVKKNTKETCDGNDLQIPDGKFNKSSRTNVLVDLKDDKHANDINTNLEQDIESIDHLNHSDDSMPRISASTSKFKKSEVTTDKNELSLEMLPKQLSEGRQRHRSDKKCNKGGKKLRVPRPVVLTKRIKLKEALLNLTSITNTISTATLTTQKITAPNNNEVKENETHNDVIVDSTRILETKCETTTSTSASTRDESEKRTSTQQNQMVNGEDEDVPWSILRKNCLLSSLQTNSRGLGTIPPLQLEIKDTLRAISRLHQDTEGNESDNEVTVTGNGKKMTEQNRFKDVTIQSSEELAVHKISAGKDLEIREFSVASSQTCNKTISLDKALDCMDDTFSVVLLKRQIRELLENNATVAHPVVKKSLKVIDVANSGASTTRTGIVSLKPFSNDPLKVKFVSLRKVSDKTVLVKWRVPRDMNNVEGYELLVDGRSVQKIISPLRCMAVVTCLPHVDKVLITIRTIVSSAVQCANYPSSTIVYRMRAK